MQNAKRFHAVCAALGCALLLGTGIGSSSFITAVLPSIMAGMGASMTEIAFGFSVGNIAAFFGALAGTRLINWLTPKWSLLVGSVCAAVVLLATAFIQSVIWWYVVRVVSGITLSIGAQAAAAGICNAFWGEKSGPVFGIVAAATAVVTASLVMVEGQLMAAYDYRAVLSIFALITLAVGLFSVLVLIGRVPTAGAIGGVGGEGPGAPAVEPGLTLAQARRSPAFWLFLAAMVFVAFPMGGYSVYATTFYVDNGVDVTVAASWKSIHGYAAAACNATTGLIVSRFGGLRLSNLCFIGFAAGLALMMGWAHTGSVPLAIIGTLLTCYAPAGINLPSLFIPQLFGKRDYVGINSAGMAAFFVGQTAMNLVFARIADTVGVNAAVVMLAALGLAAWLLFKLAFIAQRRATGDFGAPRKPEGGIGVS